MVPEQRIAVASDAPLRPERSYVLYWMTASRRIDWNYAFDRCVEIARELKKPVLVFEALRCGYQHASDRLHAFVIDGMRDNAARLASTGVGYYPYLESAPGEGKGLLAALAADACVVVTDDFPAFMLPRMTAAAAQKLDVRLEMIDSNGLMPMRATDKTFSRAFDFRRYLQRELAPWLEQAPRADALAGAPLPAFEAVAEDVARRWPPADLARVDLNEFSIDHEVGAVPTWPGGVQSARRRLETFDLAEYQRARNHPDDDVTSGLSAYLHFGHISGHEVFAQIAQREQWTPERLSDATSGARAGWWGMSEAAEGFLDQICTWREVGFNMCVTRPDDYLDYESLPDWAQQTLAEHEDDPREWTYTLEQFEQAATHDPVWNAAQNQLRGEGRLHNYLRMLWAKKILHWSASPREALAIMLHLNDRWALDGRDPNSASGIFWTLGRYDRAWGPEREIFGKIRYMTVASTKRKLRLDRYVERWSAPGEGDQAKLF